MEPCGMLIFFFSFMFWLGGFTTSVNGFSFSWIHRLHPIDLHVSHSPQTYIVALLEKILKISWSPLLAQELVSKETFIVLLSRSPSEPMSISTIEFDVGSTWPGPALLFVLYRSFFFFLELGYKLIFFSKGDTLLFFMESWWSFERQKIEVWKNFYMEKVTKGDCLLLQPVN